MNKVVPLNPRKIENEGLTETEVQRLLDLTSSVIEDTQAVQEEIGVHLRCMHILEGAIQAADEVIDFSLLVQQQCATLHALRAAVLRYQALTQKRSLH